jgi:5-methyltetrahydropteroyltriglutamate--homocysteine methyltransferase
MKRSRSRILTTHTGSLPRPPELLERLREERTTADSGFAPVLLASVQQIVRDQAKHGIDVVSDGELAKPQFADYIANRLAGMEGQSDNPGFVHPSRRPEPFPAYAAWLASQAAGVGVAASRRPVCVGPLKWKNRAYETDVENLKVALADTTVEDAFLPAPSPGIIAMRIPNDHYPSEEGFLYALAECLREEYEAIANAGLILQIDAPDVAMAWDRQDWNSLDEFRSAVSMRIEALNFALSGVPEEQIRFHVCWGNGERPHTGDIPLRDIVDLVLTVKAAAYSIEAANPRHAHEWQLWEDVKLPEGKILIPGVIDSLTNFVEHPDLVALRLLQYARLVGRENLMAGTDCGFSTAATASPRVHPELIWAKFSAMAEGSAIASQQLWK